MKLNSVEGKVRKEVEDKLRKREGNLYQEIKAEITQRLLKDNQIQEAGLEKRRTELEEENERRIKQRIHELEEKFDAEIKDIKDDHLQRLAQERARWDKELSDRLLMRSQQFTSDIAQVENLNLENKSDAMRAAAGEKEALASQISDNLKECLRHVDSAIEERHSDDLDVLQRRIASLESLHLRVHSAVRDDGQKQQFEFLSALKRITEVDQRSRDFISETNDRDLEFVYQRTKDESTLAEERNEKIVDVMQV